MSLREIETGCKLYIETDELERARGKMMQKREQSDMEGARENCL